MLIDTHCHLNFHAFESDLSDVIHRAHASGVEKIIIPSTDIPSSYKAIEIAHKYPNCYAAVGIHPHHAHDSSLILNDSLKKELSDLLSQNRVVAMGEIGLDNHRYTKTKYNDTLITDDIKMKQRELLSMQLELAVIHNKPLILHCREAHVDMIETMSAASQRISRISPSPSVKTNYIKPHPFHGVWHCFGGTAKELQDIIAMGYYIGFDGNITYSSDYSPLVASCPLDKMLLETDAPFLTPVPHRGTRNEPSYIPLIAKQVALYHSTTSEKVTQMTTANARRLFEI